jgi:hypothetical protein
MIFAVGLSAAPWPTSGRSTRESKVRALGRVLADGVREGGSIDEAFALAAAVDEFEAAHVLVLKYVQDTPVPPRVSAPCRRTSRRVGKQPS